MPQLISSRPRRLLSLCSGIGGIELGLFAAGINDIVPAQFVEIDAFCQKVLNHNFPETPIHDDLFTFHTRPGEFEFLSAGFPCQPHSLAGKQEGSADGRDLFPQVLRLIKEAQPQGILLENVPGLRHTDGGNFFKQVVREIAECGYVVEWGHNSVAGVGGVHRRKRIWILAYTSSQRRTTSGSAIACKTRTNRTPNSAGAGIEASWSQVKSKLCSGDARFSSKLVGCLMTHNTLAGWLERCSDNEKNQERKDKLVVLGNAVCPQQVAPVWKRLINKL